MAMLSLCLPAGQAGYRSGEHFLRRPLTQVRAAGFDIEQAQRFKLGLVERLVARKPNTA
jgi:hypothetical protein